ncbi:MAG: copper-binding protein [Qipengyuania citrea]|jgi:Cu/Ag efflux protein CusF|uniref:copper-binding protein n=1 Tax=Alphaproteobacteria TaxID=28211 RepID=UPI00209E65A3|nr:copper-binding protein [Qipengyuania citrea]MCP2017737.1 Cu/Ag efflux protein CusF [Qipengyuania citrea]|tara:strand:- start:87569 stop:87967 length:399 start_codon:yes stop_codon:yes gene_type:complete
MRITTLVTLLAAPLALAACDSGDNTEAMDEMPMADGQMADDQMSMDDGDMAMMGSDGAMQTASAEGTVTAIDADAGTITVDHGAVPEIEWPAMTMGFEADEQLRQDVAVGDAISFEFTTGEGGNTITSITKK